LLKPVSCSSCGCLSVCTRMYLCRCHELLPPVSCFATAFPRAWVSTVYRERVRTQSCFQRDPAINVQKLTNLKCVSMVVTHWVVTGGHNQEDQMLVCDDCGVGAHTFCCSPPLKVRHSFQSDVSR
jgi:hypothetical protein